MRQTVLLIEPDTILADQTSEYLIARGYDVRVAQSAQEAILAADKNRPDIVVLEVLLARHSGIEFLYEFRSYGEWQQVPVIVLSRVTYAELQLSKKVEKDLLIREVLYKPDTKLSKLAEQIEKSLIKIDSAQ